MRLLILIGCLLLTLLLPGTAQAHIVQSRDAQSEAITASSIVIVSQKGGDDYTVEYSFFGPVKLSSTITVPGFSLFTEHPYGPNTVEPITAATRILMFLTPSAADPQKFDAGYGFFWEDKPDKMDQLVNMAQLAAGLRRSWDRTIAIPDTRQRVQALWPYLEGTQGSACASLARQQLQKAGPIGADAIVERFWSLDDSLLLGLAFDFNSYHDERLHALLIQYLQRQQRRYEAALAKQGPGAVSVADNWDKAPEEMKGFYVDLYYGLEALGRFQDQNDLPFIRSLALWAIKDRFKQTDDAALEAFQKMPDKANLPVIDAIWKEYSRHQMVGNEMLPFDVTRPLGAHKYPETVPILVSFLSNTNGGVVAEAHQFLKEIVGEDLGADPKAWLHWYEQHRSAPH